MEQIANEMRCRIFAAYWGANCNQVMGATGKIIRISDLSVTVEFGENKTSSCELRDCKLILKPLSSISDEDAIEVAKILLPNYFANMQKGWLVSRDYAVTGYPYIKVHHPKKVSSVQIDPKLVNFDIDGMEDRETGSHDMKPAATIDYLRSKSYDCGYGSIPSLITAQIAISA